MIKESVKRDFKKDYMILRKNFRNNNFMKFYFRSKLNYGVRYVL